MSDAQTPSEQARSLIAFNQTYRDLSWAGRVCQGSILPHVTFERVDLRGVDFTGANLMHATFIHCDLQGASLCYAQLSQARFIGCQLRSCNLHGAELNGAYISREPASEYHLKHIGYEADFQRRYIYAQNFVYAVYERHSTHDLNRREVRLPAEGERLPISAQAGRPLILLHGMTGHALDFTPWLIHTERTIFAINLLGHGETSGSSLDMELIGDEELMSETHPTYLEVVSQTLEVIQQLLTQHYGPDYAENVVEFDLVGYSMGGRLALHLAHALETLPQPSQRFKRSFALHHLCVIGASLGILDEEARSTRATQDASWAESLWAQRDEPTLEHFFRAWNSQPLLARLREHNPQEAHRLSLHRLGHDPRGLAAAFYSLGQGVMPPLHTLLPSLSSSITWVCGSEDAKYLQISEEVKREYRGLDLRVISIPETGHAPHLEDFDRFWERVGPLLDGRDHSES